MQSKSVQIQQELPGGSSGLAKISTWKAPAPVSDFAMEVAGTQAFTSAQVNLLTQISPRALRRSSWPTEGINGPRTLDVHTGTALMSRYTTAITPGTGLKLTLYHSCRKLRRSCTSSQEW